MKINTGKNRLKRVAAFIGFIIITICIVIYLPCEIYNFQPAQEFSGNQLYNPYRNFSGEWQKTNFHAHAIAWNGITNGKQSPQVIINSYRQKGYNYACVSNYENLVKEDKQSNSINVYEHGYNISKTHHLVIMPQKVCYEDFPLFQFASSKQFIINKLSVDAKVVALPHPDIRNGYTDKDLKKLTGYNLIEVLNHSCTSQCKWDVALSAGKPVWIIGDDDTHNTFNTKQTFTNWTMINCNQHNKDSVVTNLANGNAYAVKGKNAFNDNSLLNVEVDSLNVVVRLQNSADSIKLIGQNGVLKKTFFNTNKVAYAFTNSDAYIRTVVYNQASTMYLNPVIRYDGKSKPQNISTANINLFKTFLYRGSLLMCWVILFRYLYNASIERIVELIRRKLQQKQKSPSFLPEQ